MFLITVKGSLFWLLFFAFYILDSQSVDAQIFKLPLHEAARVGDADEVRRLLDEGADPNQIPTKEQGPNGLTPLHSAAISNRYKIAKMLLEKGAKVSIQENYGGFTALQYAAGFASTSFVELLLKYGANIHSKTYDQRTPLHGAAAIANIGVAELLLEKGANINAKTQFGLTPLDMVNFKGSWAHSEAKARETFGYLRSKGGKTGLELTELKLQIRNAPMNAPALYLFGVIGKTFEIQYSYDLKEWKTFNTIKTKLTHTSFEEGGPFVGYVNTTAPTQFFRWRLVEE